MAFEKPKLDLSGKLEIRMFRTKQATTVAADALTLSVAKQSAAAGTIYKVLIV